MRPLEPIIDTEPQADLWAKHRTDEALLLDSIIRGGGDAFLEVAPLLGSEMFSHKASVNLWAMMGRLFAESIPLTFDDIFNRCTHLVNGLDDATNQLTRAYLLGLLDLESMTEGLHAFYAKQVASNAQRRITYQLCQKAMKELEGEAEPNHVVTSLVQATDRLAQRTAVGALSTAEVSQRLDDAKASGNVAKTYLTGIKNIDYYLEANPIIGGNTVIIAGEKGSGKTTLGLNIAYNNAKLGHKVLIITYEMTAEEKYIALAKIPTYDKMTFAHQARERINALPIFIDDNGHNTLLGVENSIRYQQLKGGVDIVMIDYLGLMAGEGKNLYEKVTHNSQGLKQMAQKLKLPFLVLAQLNRSGQQANLKPTSTALRDSGAIEQDANKVFLIHTPDKERRSEKIVIIDKNRGGALGEALVTDHFKCGAWKSRSVSDPHSGISF